MGQKRTFGPNHSSSIDWDKCHPLRITKNKKYKITTERDSAGKGSFAFIIYHGSKKAGRHFYLVKEMGMEMTQILNFKASRSETVYLSYWSNNGSRWKQEHAQKV